MDGGAMSVWERSIEDVSVLVPLTDAEGDDRAEAVPATTLSDSLRRAVPLGRMSLRHRLFLLDVEILTIVWLAVLIVIGDGRPVDAVAATAAVAAGFLSARAQGLYTTWVNSMRVVVLSRLMWSGIVSGFAAWVVHLWLDRAQATAWEPLLGIAIVVPLLAVGRTLFDRWLAAHRTEDRFCRQVLLVGTADDVNELSRFLDDHPELGYRIVGWVGPEGESTVARLGEVDAALHHVEATGVSGALILASGLNRHEVNDTTRDLVDCGVHVHIWSGLAGMNYRRLVTVPVGREPFVHVAPVSISRPQLAAKRVTDVVVATTALLVASPILLLTALLIKRHDGGPIFFRQVRVGQHGEKIIVHKLRTMVVDAEAKLAELQVDNERNGPLFKMTRDPRITPIGHFLRRTSIDELPQLLDVLRGDLSLVGPRPALPAEVAEFDEQLLGRLKVRPGITGLWQVEGRDKASFDVYRRLDLFYVENWSFALDVAILLDSVPAVLGRGLRSGDNA
jgi:exopolysaccharide biosynthesis polyprenyl glycosylphosphotransferase